jgi:hypothetical protein
MGRFYSSEARSNKYCSINQHYNTVVVEGGRGQTETGQQPDDRSDKGILGGQNIMQTSEVSVEYTCRNDPDSMSYEMERTDL